MQDGLASINVGIDTRHAFGQAWLLRKAIELTQLRDFNFSLPSNALATVANLVHQGAKRGELFVDVGVVTLKHRDLGRGLAGNQLALALLPLFDAIGLRQLGRCVVHER